MLNLQIVRKTRLVWAFAILGGVASALLWVGRAQAESLGFSLIANPAPGTAAGDVTVVVLDDDTLKPLSEASVSMSDSLADQSPALKNLTGLDGSSLFKEALNHAHTLTVAKEGYTTTSLVGLQSAQVTVYLKPLPRPSLEASDQVIASGTLTGWPSSSPGDMVNAGVVLRSMSAQDLLHFDPDSLISPLKDTIDLFGPRAIPSNLVLPQQEIFLLLGSITLNKPTYRLPVARGKSMSIAGVQGRMAVNDIVALAQTGGKVSIGLLNKLQFTRAGITQNVTPQADFSLDVNAGFALRPQSRVMVSAAPFPADILVAAATDMTGDRSSLLPTDIKLAVASGATGPIKMVTLNASDSSVGQAHTVISIAMGEKAHRLSGIVNEIVTERASVNPGAFLPVNSMPDAPSVPESITVQPIKTGLTAAVYESGSTALWYVYTLPSAGPSLVPSRRLPQLDQVTAFSVVQLDFGAGFDERTLDGRTAMRSLRRFARSTAKVVKPTP